MFWLIFRAGRALPPIRGVSKDQVVKGNGIPGPAIVIVVIISAVAIGWMMIHGLSNSVLIGCMLLFPVIIFAGWIAAGISRDGKSRKRIEKMPDVPQQAQAVSYRQRAATLEATGEYEDMLASIRAKRVQDIMKASCPACHAASGDPCTVADAPGYLLDKDRGIAVHGARIGNSIKTRTAKADDISAQFAGNVPADIREYA